MRAARGWGRLAVFGVAAPLLAIACGGGTAPPPRPTPTPTPAVEGDILYVLDRRELRSFAVVAETGALVERSRVPAPDFGRLAVRPGGDPLYVAAPGREGGVDERDRLDIYRADAQGVLTASGSFDFPEAGHLIWDLAAGGDRLFVASRNYNGQKAGAAWVYGTSAGAPALLSTLEYDDPVFVDASRDGRRVYLASAVRLLAPYQFDLWALAIGDDGRATGLAGDFFVIDDVGVSVCATGALAPSGDALFFYDGFYLRAYGVGPDGALVKQGLVPATTGKTESFCAIAARHDLAYVALTDSGAVRLFSFDRARGELAARDDIPLEGTTHNLVWGPGGRFLYVTSREVLRIYEVDEATRRLREVGQVPGVAAGATLGTS